MFVLCVDLRLEPIDQGGDPLRHGVCVLARLDRIAGSFPNRGWYIKVWQSDRQVDRILHGRCEREHFADTAGVKRLGTFGDPSVGIVMGHVVRAFYSNDLGYWTGGGR